MKILARCLLAWLGLALAALPASAAFHLFTINEIYSNADGTIQFIELTALAGGQQFTSGHSLTASSGGVTHIYNVTTDLPGDTGGRRFLFGTQGFAALGVVQPDYVIPNNFLFPGGGSVNWAGADIWNHGAIPTDGDLSLNRSGTTSPNSPTNFAGTTGHIVLSISPVPSFQGLWWKSPPPPAQGSEDGWGVNLTHQGDNIFATWFTYAADGSGLWLGALLARQGTSATYSGALARNQGDPLLTNPWRSSSHVVIASGSASMTFTDANNGSFSYTLDGITQTKAITKQIFALPVPECLFTGAQVAPFNYSDLWWKSPPPPAAGSEDGWGINLTHQGTVIFATWFTYDTDGKGLWLAALVSPTSTANQFTGTLLRTRGAPFSDNPWNSALKTSTPVGSATFLFTDANHATFTYTFNGTTQTKTIERQVFGSPVSICR